MGGTNSRDVEIKRIEAQKAKEQQAHEARMKQAMINAKNQDRENQKKQRDQAVNQLQSAIDDLEKSIKEDSETLKVVVQGQKEAEAQVKIKQDLIDRWDEKWIAEQCKLEKEEADGAHAKYKRSDEEILAAIAKTGQDEDNVGRFLTLTHNLIGQTTSTQANVNKLDAEMTVFQTLLQRVSQDKLGIEYYFKEQGLQRFVPILDKQGFKDCQHLVCSGEEEFKSHILGYLTEEIDKDIEAWKKRHPDEVDPFDAFLEKYKLKKFKAALEDSGLDSLEGIDEDLDDEMVDELIDGAGMKGLHKKKFKRAINDVKTGKYQGPATQTDEKKDDDSKSADKDEKPRAITLREQIALENICYKNVDQWKKFEGEKTVSTRDALLQMGPILGGFFENLHDAVQSTQKLLECNNDDELNAQQKEAMVTMMDGDTKAIEAGDSVLMDNNSATDIRFNNGGPFDMKYTDGANWPFGGVSSGSTQSTEESSSSFSIAGQYSYGDDTISFGIALNEGDEILLSVVRGSYQAAIEKLEAGPSRISASSWQATIKTFKPSSDDIKYGVAIVIDTPQDSDNKEADKEDVKQEEDQMDPALLSDYEQRKAWKEASKVQVYSKSEDKWFDGQIAEITTDKEGEWLNIKYKTRSQLKEKQVDRFGKDVRDPKMVEGRAIARRIQVDIDVVSGFRKQFEENATTKRALPMALGVQASVGSIMVSQSQIRQSVRLAGDILKLKPANLTDKSKPLWEAVDGGVLHILNSYLEMNKISAQYFGYFLRFNSSFQEFISMNTQNKDVSLFVSLEHLQQDITQFSAFREQFEIKLAELTKEATKVIQDCVKKHIGEQMFEAARKSKQESKKQYLATKKAYDDKMTEVLKSIEDERLAQAQHKGKLAELKFREEKLTEGIARKQGYIKDYNKEKTKLQKMTFSSKV